MIIVAAMSAASFGPANAQSAGQTYDVTLSTSPDTIRDCYHFGGAGPGGDFSSALRDPQGLGTEHWNRSGALLTSYVFAGLTESGVAWGGSGLVLLDFLLFSGQEISENGVGVGYTVSGFARANCELVVPLGVGGASAVAGQN